MEPIERLRFLGDLDRYMSLLDRHGPEPSIGPAFGTSPNLPNIFFVDSVSGSNNNNGRRPDRAVASLDTAIGLCTANNGDVIIVMPGHAETITAANGIDADIAGISIIGVGHGSDRPEITLDTVVGASFRINAVNVWVEGLRFRGNLDALTNVLVINGVADVTLKDIEYIDVTGQCDIFLAAADGSDRLHIDGLRYYGAAAAGSTRALAFDGCDDLHLENFYIYGNFSTSAVDFRTTLSARVHVHDGLVWTENAADLCFNDTITGSTGSFHTLALILQDNAANVTEAITGATFQVAKDDVHVVNLVNEKAMLINWPASTDA